MLAHRAWFGIAVFALAASGASGQVTRRVSIDSAGNQGNAGSLLWAGGGVSADGRWVVFYSNATNLVPGDTNGTYDVFVRDLQSGTTECVSVDPNGTPVGGGACSMSSDGRYVLFSSRSPDIVAGTSGRFEELFLRNRSSGTTELVSVAPDGSEANDFCDYPHLSADGRWIVFTSGASNLAPGGSNAWLQVFLRDRQSGTNELISIGPGGALGNSHSHWPSVSSDGRFVSFDSFASNFGPVDTNGTSDIYVRDRLNAVTLLASVGPGGVQGNGPSYAPWMSADGRFVSFTSGSLNLVPGDTNGFEDVFVRDLQNGTTELVSVSSSGTQGDGNSGWDFTAQTISPDGRYVVFLSWATNLCSGDTNGQPDMFLRDRLLSTTERVNVSSGGAEALAGSSDAASISSDGRFVVFASADANLVPGDTNSQTDVFLRDRMPGSETTAFTSLCSPGSGSVIACPCSNPPSGPDRGCDNSDATGGASLSAAGNTQLSADGLTLTASAMRMSSLSVLAQGTALLSNGLVYGQGVRCVGGLIRRLYTKSAQGGAATYPDFQAGESPISVRSAQKGDSILPGQSRWYIVYYRDPVVLGGCPVSSTFNATQTGQIDWSL